MTTVVAAAMETVAIAITTDTRFLFHLAIALLRPFKPLVAKLVWSLLVKIDSLGYFTQSLPLPSLPLGF